MILTAEVTIRSLYIISALSFLNTILKPSVDSLDIDIRFKPNSGQYKQSFNVKTNLLKQITRFPIPLTKILPTSPQYSVVSRVR